MLSVFEANTETYDEQLTAAEYVVVDYYGDHCGYCVYMEPFYKEACRDMPYIHFVKINVTHNQAIADRYGIDAVPELKFFHNGQEVHQALGGMDRTELNEHIAKLLYHGF